MIRILLVCLSVFIIENSLADKKQITAEENTQKDSKGDNNQIYSAEQNQTGSEVYNNQIYLAKENQKDSKGDLEKLLSFKTISTDFIQTDKMDNKSTGHIFWDRKNQMMKMNYLSGQNQVIIIKNDRAIFYDRELNEKSESSYHSSPLAFLMNKKINLSNVVILHDIVMNNMRYIKLTKKQNDVGAIEIIFSQNPFSLKGWIVYDQKNDLYGTEISLVNTKYNQEIDAEEFEKFSAK